MLLVSKYNTNYNYILYSLRKYPEEDNNKAVVEFKKERIPKSNFFDIDELAIKSKFSPLMIPTLLLFKRYMKRLDIRKTDTIICYDQIGIYSSPRVWFLFNIFGASNVYVLNGGLPKWKEKYPSLDRKSVV